MNGNISNEGLIRFLDTEELQKIIEEYNRVSGLAESAGFNVFTMTSDVFHRENYHSDIIKAFLDPEEEHGEGSKFLYAFIDMLNSAKYRNGCLLGEVGNVEKIDKLKYAHALVSREPERIDILIKGDRHCIIIENKINEARDMDRQLPRYYDAMNNPVDGKDRYEVDAIVYLTKSPALPSETKWRNGDKKNVYPRLTNIIIDSELQIENSLIKSWITPCLKISSNLDCISILRQYSKLLKTLIPTAKREKAMSEFLTYLKMHHCLGQAKTVAEMMTDMPSQMARSLQTDINSTYSQKFDWATFGVWPVWSRDKMICVIGLPEEYRIFVICDVNQDSGYTVCLKNFGENVLQNEEFPDLQGMSVDTNKQLFFKTFGFYDNKKVIDYVGELLERVKPIVMKNL